MWKFGITFALGSADLISNINETEAYPDRAEKVTIKKNGIGSVEVRRSLD